MQPPDGPNGADRAEAGGEAMLPRGTKFRKNDLAGIPFFRHSDPAGRGIRRAGNKDSRQKF